MDLSRRDFFKKVGTDAAAAGLIAGGIASVTVTASPLGLPIGSQTYPHRALIKEHGFAGLAKTLAGIGVRALELCSPIGYQEFAPLADGRQVKAVLADHGLICQSAHFSMRELRESQAKSIAWAQAVGITQMVTATLGGGNTPTLDGVKRAADEYHAIAAAAATAGMQQGLHNEGFEMSAIDGRRTYDLLLDLLDPALVKFQFQMSTISRGFVAHEYFTKYPGRFNSMHLQDVDLKAAPGENGRPVQTAIGKGSIDWTKTFAAAKTGGVKSYYIEQNMELTKEGIAFLRQLRVA